VRIGFASVGLCIGLCWCALVVHQLICILGCVGAHRLCISWVVYWVVPLCINCALVDLCIGLCRCASVFISRVVHWVVSVRIGCASVDLCIGLSLRINCASVGLCIGLCRCASVVHQSGCVLGCDGAHRLCIS